MNEPLFKFGQIVEGEYFCNRATELADLARMLQGGASVWVYSPRRYGKSSLVRTCFGGMDPSTFLTVEIDLYATRSTTDLTRILLAGFARTLQAHLGTVDKALDFARDLLAALRPAITLDPSGQPQLTLERREPSQVELEEILDLPARLAERADRRVVVALDEFQEIDRIDGLDARLRSVFQQQSRVSYVLCGSKRHLMERMFADRGAPLYGFARHLEIGPIEKSEWLAYLTQRLASASLTVDPDLLEMVIDLAGGHPHYVQLFAQHLKELIDREVDPSRFEEELIAVILASQESATRLFLDGLTSAQLNVLRVIASGTRSGLLSETVRTRFALPATSTVQSALKSLYAHGVLDQLEGEYRLLDPVLELYLKERLAV